MQNLSSSLVIFEHSIKLFNLISAKIGTKIILKKSTFQNFLVDFIATTSSVAFMLPALNFHKHLHILVKIATKFS